MTVLVDPIELIAQLKKQHKPTEALAAEEGLAYEVPLVPPLGAKLMRMTIASTYRTPIPVLFDSATCTTYPLSNEG